MHLSMQETSYGVLRPPLGSVRLTIIELVAVLLRTGSEEAETAIIESGAVQEVLQVFLRFPFNSILHHQAGPYPHSSSQLCMPVALIVTGVLPQHVKLCPLLLTLSSRACSSCHSIACVQFLRILACFSWCQERQASGLINCRQLCPCERVFAQKLYTR